MGKGYGFGVDGADGCTSHEAHLQWRNDLGRDPYDFEINLSRDAQRAQLLFGYTKTLHATQYTTTLGGEIIYTIEIAPPNATV